MFPITLLKFGKEYNDMIFQLQLLFQNYEDLSKLEIDVELLTLS